MFVSSNMPSLSYLVSHNISMNISYNNATFNSHNSMFPAGVSLPR